MIRLTINSQKHGEVYKDLASQAEVDVEIVDSNVANSRASFHWGKLAYTEVIPAKPAIVDDQGIIITPAQPSRTVNHPATVTFTQKDITQELNQKALNKTSQDLLDSTDWKVLRHLREKSLQIPTSLTEAQYVALEQARNLAARKII